MNLPSASATSRVTYQRKLRYVDASIQRSLLVAMVALEVGLVIALTCIAYWHLNGLLEENLYRVHLAQSGPTLSRLAEEGFVMLAWFAGINIFVLMLAEGIWSQRENLVLQDFSKLIERVRALDFSSDPPATQSHEILALTITWRARERERFTAVRKQLTALEAAVSADASAHDIRELTERLRALMP